MKTKKWEASLLPMGPGWEAAGGGTVSSHKDRARIILKGANYATMLAYLWRRFGPPPSGWDDHKELVNYWITTPAPGIGFGLACSPSFESCGAGVFYAIDESWSKRVREWECGKFDEWMSGLRRHLMVMPESGPIASAIESYMDGPDMWALRENSSASWLAYARRQYRDYLLRVGPLPDIRHFDEWPGMPFGLDRPPVALDQLEASPHREILAAIEDGLRDLLRPVAIRDSYINACGRVDERSPLMRRAVARFEDAGYGCRTKKGDAA